MPEPFSTRPLPSWKDGASRDNIIGFVEQTCGEGAASLLDTVVSLKDDWTKVF